jgi:hypothetical protein
MDLQDIPAGVVEAVTLSAGPNAANFMHPVAICVSTGAGKDRHRQMRMRADRNELAAEALNSRACVWRGRLIIAVLCFGLVLFA